MKHYPSSYLKNPEHRITVDLIGMGGTGSQMLSGLARISASLLMLNHPGLHVRTWDEDIVTEANVGRQLFSDADLGMNKAMVLTTRVNRYFGFEWEAKPQNFPTHFLTDVKTSNITISCVDKIAPRLYLDNFLSCNQIRPEPFDFPLYWLDIGNLQQTGQVVLGTVKSIAQPKAEKKNSRSSLPNVVKVFPQLKKMKEDLTTPSCSLAEALEKQDLFINSTLAQFACCLLWKLFREEYITHHGCYLNLDSFIVNPIKIK